MTEFEHPWAAPATEMPEMRRPRIYEDAAELQRIGDCLQSEASRLAEWVRHAFPYSTLPYEVGQALLGVESNVEGWTQVRRRMNRAGSAER